MEQGNSAFLVDYKDHRILIDCGGTVPYVLRDEMGIPLQSITDIIVTHAHGDHISGLEQLLYSCYFLGNKHRPMLWVSADVGMDVLTTLNMGMRHLKGKPAPLGLVGMFNTFLRSPNGDSNSRAEIFQPSDTFKFEDLPLVLRDVEHVNDMPATSVRLGPLFISGDTNSPVRPPDDVELVFHEAEFGFATGVHCPVEHLVNTHHPLRSKTWLYHCPPSIVDAPEGFAGILKKGQVFELEIP